MLRGKFLNRFSYAIALFFLIGFPSVHLNLWVLPILIAFYSKPLVRVLWISLAMGALLDLVGSHERLGIYSLSCTITTLMLYRLKRHFFEDSLSTLPVLTALYSATFTLVLMLLLQPLSARAVVTDLFLMPIADGIAVFVMITMPLLAIQIKKALPDQTAAHRPR